MGTRTVGCLLLAGLVLSGACGDDVGADSGGGRDAAVRTSDAAQARNDAAQGPGDPNDPGESPGDADADGGFVLECPRGGKVSVVHAEFRCNEITVYTCKDLSNVVIEYEDGTRQRIMGVNGHVNRFVGTGANAGKRIVRVWVKAGSNSSGDGPGFGERFDAPSQTCTPPTAGTGSAGNGGTGGTCVPGPDVSCVPIPTSGTGGSGGAGGAAGSAGEGGPRPD